MAVHGKSQQNQTSSREVLVPEEFETTDSSQTTLFSIDMPASSAAIVQVRANAYDNSFGAAAMLVVEAGFRRTAEGNIVRATGSGGLLGATLRTVGDFLFSQPSLDLTANTETNQIDIQARGKASTTIKWILEITVIKNK